MGAGHLCSHCTLASTSCARVFLLCDRVLQHLPWRPTTRADTRCPLSTCQNVLSLPPVDTCFLLSGHLRSNVSRDRGLRALLEMVGSVAVLFFLSWRLAPVCSIVILATAVAAAIYRWGFRMTDGCRSRMS